MTAIVLPTSEDVRQLVAEVWASILGEDFHELAPAEADQRLAEPDAVGSAVVISGPWTGRITLDLCGRGADQLARAMFGQPTGELPAGDLADAVGELGNIIAGNIKSSLPEPSSLSLPEVRFGPLPQTLPAPGVSSELAWDDHQVRVCLIESERVGA
ncbi:MAG TPA: chemotaxis protein CheX [Jatrophihabitans sp.]|nr:chemotaxis protein CheX [Jatrophihabitans sp.]